MVASHRTAESVPTPSRRRGAVLERAILDAALEQLGTVGWNGLTMEGVAVAARTGKAAVYRRWPSKQELVADALRSALPGLEAVPDLGGVRDDLLWLCLRVRDAMFSRSGCALRSVIHECDPADAEGFRAVILGGLVGPTVAMLRQVIVRGAERGEVRPDAADGHLVDVIPAMMMYRTKVYGSEWADGEIEELIDRVMVPLLRPTGT
ncbi:TetR/AcrR family transcriptional regulator [Streptomyces sp. SID8352]|uniref:TetR/AcrR family transcriptional regulator n=1 Tax=Streptomyces sp. SID8352 TaxID=2690338 RepID=UPI00136FC005|nr:TetR/AcrR family transcriptional regulator [Streptomyces sp. SID8352]MYU24996.1 TetR family transcriptional regulator [Streptomyces sp. SID8352]